MPGLVGALEHNDLGVLFREAVVVARLASDAAGAVDHVGAREIVVYGRVGLRDAAAAS